MEKRGTQRLFNGHRRGPLARRLVYRRVKIGANEERSNCDVSDVNITILRNSSAAGNHLTARFRTSIEWRTTHFASRHTNDRLQQEDMDEKML